MREVQAGWSKVGLLGPLCTEPPEPRGTVTKPDKLLGLTESRRPYQVSDTLANGSHWRQPQRSLGVHMTAQAPMFQRDRDAAHTEGATPCL